ncbi:PTS mannose/fructose/sorbose transporter subunit IIC [Buttiauxella gaviniae]|uniref:PTS mannose/fructose/sorbose transporter subunit IIC n=1 Tax=Buttiauxella gaviniae TaxID=82990 RepID=UPI0039B059B1
MDTLQIIALVIIALIAGMGSVLDEGQTHRPLIACTLVGVVLGDITTGVILGGTLEMMALGWMNVGLAMAPDTAIASVIATILVITTHQGVGEGIAIAVALAAAGQVLTIFTRTITVFFIHRADKYATKGSTRGIELMHVSALILQGLRVALPTLAVVMMNVETVQAMLADIPHVVTRGLQIGGGIVVVVGYAMVINMMNVKYLMPFFFGGFLLAAFTNFNLVGFGGMGLVIALLWMQIHPKYQAKTALAATSGPANQVDDDDLDA